MMLTFNRLLPSVLLLVALSGAAFAQDEKLASPVKEVVSVTASAAVERVRFTAPSTVVQLRLEVYDASGKKFFDNELRGGNVLDWQVQNGQAERLPSGAYLCVVTVKSLSGKLAQKLANLQVEANSVSLKAADYRTGKTSKLQLYILSQP
jgi:hypothetical protein